MMLADYEFLFKLLEKYLKKYNKCLINIISNEGDGYITINYYNLNDFEEEIKNIIYDLDYLIISYLKKGELKQSIFSYHDIRIRYKRFLGYKRKLEYNKPRYVLKLKINVNNLKIKSIKKYADEDSLLKISGVKFELIENKDYTNLYIYLNTTNQKIIEYYNNKNYDYLYDEVKKELIKYNFLNEYKEYISRIFKERLYNTTEKIREGLKINE